jgi:hypothetical protein
MNPMSRKKTDAILRADRIMVGALAVVLAALSGAVGATAAYHPRTEVVRSVALASPQAVLEAGGEVTAAQLPAVVSDPVPVPGVARQDYRIPANETVMQKLLREHKCLSEALYYEARGEGLKGQKAVAEVIFHRMRMNGYGHSICAVVYEGAGRPGCQFSFACNGSMTPAKAQQAWMQAQMLAARILTGEERLTNSTDGATSYHALSVQPDWAATLVRTVQIGNHIFYRNFNAARTM